MNSIPSDPSVSVKCITTVNRVEGESNADYWARQAKWFDQEAIRIGGWCEGAKAMLDVEPAPKIHTYNEAQVVVAMLASLGLGFLLGGLFA